MQGLKDSLQQNNACILVPTYNNDQSLGQVLAHFKGLGKALILIDDGSTDQTKSLLADFEEFTIISYEDNQGKGQALQRGFKKAIEAGFRYAISIDSDGQHSAEDVPKFLEKIQFHPDALIVGSRDLHAENMPGKNSFGNTFSNFWYHIETGQKLPDTQSGFRLYPLNEIKNMRFYTKKYEFELEVLVRAAWSRIPVIPMPISVYYPPPEERVSHFKPSRDFFRISVLNAVLVIAGLLYYRPLNIIKSLTRKNIAHFFQTRILKTNETIEKKASAIGFGIFMGIVPLWGYQMILAVIFAHYFKLNKAMVLLASNISIGPMIPLTIYLSFMFGGLFMENPAELVFDREAIDLSIIWDQLFQYIVGSISLAIAAGLFAGSMAYGILWIYQKIKLKLN